MAQTECTRTQPCGGCFRTENENGAARDFYVSVIDGTHKGFLLGPYATHPDALAQVDRGRSLTLAADQKAHFYGFGTCSAVPGTIKRTVFDS